MWITNPDTLPETWAKRRHDAPTAQRCSARYRPQSASPATHATTSQASSRPPPTGGDDASSAAAYTNGTPVASLEVAAELVAAKEPPKVVYVTNIGDYDTHQGQTARQQALHADLDTALERFFTSVTNAGVADNVIVVTLSEFGRRVQENGSGTDHGAAGAHFIIGSQVKGGRYGKPTTLSTLDPAATSR